MVWPIQRIPIVQYGTPRTGSAFQFHLLCIMARMSLLSFNNHSNVVCSFAKNASEAEALIQKNGHLLVLKMHDRPPDVCRNKGCFVFSSHTNHEEKWPESIYQQVLSEFRSTPLKISSSYKTTFNLNENFVDKLQGYMRYWSILRQCCGNQMSQHQRLILHGCADTISTDSLSYPACELYNRNELSNLLSRTFVVRMKLETPVIHDYNAYCNAEDQKIIEGNDFNGAVFKGCDTLRSPSSNPPPPPSPPLPKLPEPSPPPPPLPKLPEPSPPPPTEQLNKPLLPTANPSNYLSNKECASVFVITLAFVLGCSVGFFSKCIRFYSSKKYQTVKDTGDLPVG